MFSPVVRGAGIVGIMGDVATEEDVECNNYISSGSDVEL